MGNRCFVFGFKEKTGYVSTISMGVREDFIHIFLTQLEDLLEQHLVLRSGFPFATRITDHSRGTPFGKGLCSNIRQDGSYYSISSLVKKGKTDLIVATWVLMLQAMENIVRTYGDEVASCSEMRQTLLFQDILRCEDPYIPNMKGFIRLYDGMETEMLSNRAFRNMRKTYTELSPQSQKGGVSCVMEEDGFRMTCRENGTCGEVLSLEKDVHRRLYFSSKKNSFTTSEQTLTVLAGLTTMCS